MTPATVGEVNETAEPASTATAPPTASAVLLANTQSENAAVAASPSCTAPPDDAALPSNRHWDTSRGVCQPWRSSARPTPSWRRARRMWTKAPRQQTWWVVT